MKHDSTASADGNAHPAQPRCRPGDLAKVVSSKISSAIGRTVIVEHFSDEHDRWAATVLGEPVFGLGIEDQRPMLSNRVYFRDRNLVPLRGDEQETTERETEVSHG